MGRNLMHPMECCNLVILTQISGKSVVLQTHVLTSVSVVTCAIPCLGRRGSVLLQGMVGSVTCVAAHPLLPRLVVLCDSGDIHLWDYNLKVKKQVIMLQL